MLGDIVLFAPIVAKTTLLQIEALYGKRMYIVDESRINLANALNEMHQNEWAVSDWRDNAIKNINSVDAFESIMPALGLALEQTDYYAFDSCCGLALQFAGVARTTEQPKGLVLLLKLLNSHEVQLTRNNRKVKEIAKWFRASNVI